MRVIHTTAPIVGILVLSTLSACRGDVGTSYRIDSGIEPRHQDEDVRFRTTYYFRVFDVCDVLDERQRTGDYAPVDRTFTKRVKGTYKLLNDSLYRFRMTGKASAWFQNVIFESGSLRAEQIDPFGASIDYDEATRKFRLHSASENREIQQRNDIYTEVRRLYKLRDEAKDKKHPEAVRQIETLIVQQLERLTTRTIMQSASVALIAADARESVKAAIRALLEAPAAITGTEVEEHLRDLEPSDDQLLKAADSFKTQVDSLHDLFEKVIAKLKQAMEGKQNEVSLEEKALRAARTERDKMNDEMQKAKRDLENARKAAATSGLTEMENALAGVQKKLDDASSKVLEKEKSLEDHRRIMSRLTEAQREVEAEADRLDQLTGILDRSAREESSVRSMTGGAGTASCPNGKPSRRGFQVLGPEGFRSFDQDERLVMAMTTDAKPLIGMLQQFADQRFTGDTNRTGPLMAIAEERAHLASAHQVLSEIGEKLESTEKPDHFVKTAEIIELVIRAFNTDRNITSVASPVKTESNAELKKALEAIHQ